MLPDLDRVLACAASNHVKLALENVPTTSERMLGMNIAEVIDVVSLFSTDTVGICLDLTHCLAAGYDPLKALACINLDRLISIHASDNYTGTLEDRHLTIGQGEIPWGRLFHRLHRLNFEGSMVIEVAGGENAEIPLVESLEYLRHLGIYP